MNQENWEKEFDRKVGKINYRDFGIDWEEFKPFIRTLIQQTQEETLKELLPEYRKGMDRKTEGFNQCIAEIKSKVYDRYKIIIK